MLKKRIIVGLSVAFFFAAVLASSCGPLLGLLLIAFSSICQLEFYKLVQDAGYKTSPRLSTALGALFLFVQFWMMTKKNFFYEESTALPIIAALFFIILVATLFNSKEEKPFENVATSFLGILYLPVMLSYFLRIATINATTPFEMPRASVFLVFFIIIVIKMSDTGAFAVGTICAKTIGTHPLFKRISPKKSIEGLIGGIVVGTLTGLVLALLAQKYNWGAPGVFTAGFTPHPNQIISYMLNAPALLTPCSAAIFSSVIVLVGVLGDLIESMFKRAASIKDSSSLFPAMGGLLDVADSLIFIPVIFYYLIFFGSIAK